MVDSIWIDDGPGSETGWRIVEYLGPFEDQHTLAEFPCPYSNCDAMPGRCVPSDECVEQNGGCSFTLAWTWLDDYQEGGLRREQALRRART